MNNNERKARYASTPSLAPIDTNDDHKRTHGHNIRFIDALAMVEIIAFPNADEQKTAIDVSDGIRQDLWIQR